MATKTCPSCGGSGYPSMSGVMPGSQKNVSACSTCGGRGWVNDNSSSYSNGGNGGCFTGDAKVKIPGGWKKIKDLKQNEFVVSLDKRGNLINRRILRVKSLKNRKVQTISGSKNSISVTPGHSIQLSDGRWKRISKLNPGDSINYIDHHGSIGKQVIIDRKKKCSETVYNLVVENDFNFIVEGWIAHSFSYFKKLKGLYYTFFSISIKRAKRPLISNDFSFDDSQALRPRRRAKHWVEVGLRIVKV